jgi:hypothetical protein
MTVTGLVETKRRFRIRSIFMNRRESYGLNEVRRLTGRSPESIRCAVRDGEMAASHGADDYRLTWPQVARIAVDLWGMEAIEDELGPVKASYILPPLVRMETITLRLPRYQVAMLQELAKRRESSANRIVADALLPMAHDSRDVMEAAIPGFAEAIDFPQREWKRTLSRRE